MTPREKRRQERLNSKIAITKTSLYSEENSSFHRGLSPKESWELLDKISKEQWFIQTGVKAPEHLDKSAVKIISRDA